jgi:RNA polymerase sigma-70 factor (ECF subfamily)
MPSQSEETEQAGRDPEPAALAPEIHRCLQQARREWPGITTNPERFASVLARSLRERGAEGPGRPVRSIRSTDLYLACACAEGNPAAIAVIEERFFPDLDRAFLRLGFGRSTIEELKQQLRCRLFTGCDDAPPLVTSYLGRGELRSWLRSVAVREGLHWLRRERKSVPLEDEESALGLVPDDPELLLMKHTYGEAFRAAFAAAMGSLSSRERNVLRQHFVDGLSIDKLAVLYRVHRATAARWLTRLQEALLQRTRTALRERLGVSEEELDSIMRLARSQLNQSVRGLLS